MISLISKQEYINEIQNELSKNLTYWENLVRKELISSLGLLLYFSEKYRIPDNECLVIRYKTYIIYIFVYSDSFSFYLELKNDDKEVFGGRTGLTQLAEQYLQTLILELTNRGEITDKNIEEFVNW